MRVIGRTSSFSFKGKAADIGEIGRKLNVETVLDGSIQVSGDKLRVTASLTNVGDGYLLWSDNYDQKIDDILDIQDDIARKIVNVLEIKLLGKEQTQLVKHYTENREAYNLYLKGRYYWNKRQKDDVLKSIEYFEEAVNKDPAYALGYSGMGLAFVVLGTLEYFPSKEVFPKARENALKALAIDKDLDEAHVVLGAVLNWYERDFPGSDKEFKRAIEINPGNADAHHWYAFLLINLGRNEAAIEELLTARELDPLSPQKNADVGWGLFCTRDYVRAVVELKKSLEMFPEHAYNYRRIARVYFQLGKYGEAFESIQHIAGRPEAAPLLAYAYALSGRKDKAQEILDNISKDLGQQFFSPTTNSRSLCGLGRQRTGPFLA